MSKLEPSQTADNIGTQTTLELEWKKQETPFFQCRQKKQSSFINGPDFPTLITTGAINFHTVTNHTLYVLNYILKGLDLLDSLIKCSPTGLNISLNG